MVRAHDFKIAGLAWIGQTSVGEERAAPCGLDLRDFAVDDIAWKTKHHVLGVTAVQAGLQHERRTALRHANHITLHGAGWRLPRDRSKRGFMTIQVLDGVLQPSSRILGVELHLHENVVIHRVQTIAESNHRCRLRLFGDRQFVIDCGQLAFDVIQKSQEPTSYLAVLP